MILSFEDIVQRIKQPLNKDVITRATKIHKDHVRHVYGEGVDTFLEKIEGFENEAQKKIRLKYVGTPTVPIYGRTLMNMEKVFSAQGGRSFFEFSSEKVEEDFHIKLSNVGEGMSLSAWMEIIWKDKVNTDPSGLNFIEVDGEGVPYLTYKSIIDIHDYDFTGVDVEYVIFAPEIRKSKDGRIAGRYYRVVDDEKDIIIKEEKNSFTEVEDETYENLFGKVPATLFSTQKDTISKAKTSYVFKSITIADDYLVDASIHKLYKKKHGYPVFAMRGVQCTSCKGEGYIRTDDEDVECFKCSGSGTMLKKDVSDALEMPILENNEQPDPMSPVAVYVHAPTEISVEQREILKELELKIYDSVWGENTFERENKSTATGEMINISYVVDKLENISNNAEIVESKLADLFGHYYYQDAYQGSIVNYGRNYILKKADQLWKEYSEKRANGASQIELDRTYKEYLRSKYQKDANTLNEALKLMSVEPNFHLTTKELIDIGASREEILTKQYFNEFITWFNLERNGIRDIPVLKLKEELKNYIKNNFDVKLNSNNDE